MAETNETLTVDIRGAAKLVGIPYGTFRRMVKNGRAPAGLQPMPRVIRFRVEELRAWVAAGMPSAVPRHPEWAAPTIKTSMGPSVDGEPGMRLCYAKRRGPGEPDPGGRRG